MKLFQSVAGFTKVGLFGIWFLRKLWHLRLWISHL